jgi:hypothetical protein
VIVVAMAGALVLPRWAEAGEIGGMLWKDGRPMAGVEVTLTCRVQSTTRSTDNFGRYRVDVPGATGRCTLSVAGAQVEVFLLDSPGRYDFELIGSALRRR